MAPLKKLCMNKLFVRTSLSFDFQRLHQPYLVVAVKQQHTVVFVPFLSVSYGRTDEMLTCTKSYSALKQE